MRSVTVQFFKNPDVPHWGYDARLLGEDEWGVWLALPAGSPRWKGGETHRPTQHDAVLCAPREGWWHLHYNGSSNSWYSHFVDIVTTPVWISESRYEMIDLDLDVAIRQDGTIEIQDEDEFEIHQVKYRYTEDMIRGAERETARIVAELEARREPFFDVASAWLGEMTRDDRVR